MIELANQGLLWTVLIILLIICAVLFIVRR